MIDAVMATHSFPLPASALRETIVTLLFGWITFLGRVLPRMTIDPGSMIVAVVALVMFTGGAQLLARKIYRRFVEDRPGLPHVWRLKWTVAAVVGLFVLFAAGISLVGATHQFAWLATEDERLTGTGHGNRWVDDTRSTMKQIGLGLHNYHDVHSSFPAGGLFDADGTARHSWVSPMLVYLNYEYVIDFDYPWRHPKNEPHFHSVLPELINAGFRTTEYRDAEGFGLSHFAANARLLGPNVAPTVKSITDGTANTVMIGETNTGFRPWGDPVNWRDPALGFGESPLTFGGVPHAGGVTFLMADGSVRAVSNDTDDIVLRALATPAGEESAPMKRN